VPFASPTERLVPSLAGGRHHLVAGRRGGVECFAPQADACLRITRSISRYATVGRIHRLAVVPDEIDGRRKAWDRRLRSARRTATGTLKDRLGPYWHNFVHDGL